MVILAAFFLLACNPDNQKQCVVISDATYETMAKCKEAADEITTFWRDKVGEEAPLPLHCEDEAEHT